MLGALLAAGCGGPAIQYFKVGYGVGAPLTGTDCPMSTTAFTVTGVESSATLALYADPDGKYFLDTNSGSLFGITNANIGLTGSANGSSYTLTGSWVQDIAATAASVGVPGTPEVKTTVKATYGITTTAGALTGTATYEFICHSGDNMSCGSGNALDMADGVSSADGHDFDCTTSASITGVRVSSPQEVVQQ
jgi:hypothetical protein